MRYRAIFIGGPLDGQERVTEQLVSEVFVQKEKDRCVGYAERMEHRIMCKYSLLFAYGENTLLYSTMDTTKTLDLLLDSYMEEANETIF
jgi:hypothetical protein